MSQKPLPRTQKETAVASIVDYIIETHQPHKAPIVLMWREVITGYDLKYAPDRPSRWIRDTADVHQHWKTYGRPTAKALRKNYNLTAVPVNRSIRDLVGHGNAPDLSTKKNKEAYARCLASSSSPTFGMVVFPRDTSQDHPLIVLSNQRRCQTAGSTIENAIGNLRTTNDLGCLSDDTTKEIVESTRQVVTNTFSEDKHPLFRQITEQS